jgi:hypothetical protein
MKKQLLLASVLAASTAISQVPAKIRIPGLTDIVYNKYATVEKAASSNVTAGPSVPVVAPGKAAKTSGLSVSWNAISKSINVYGVLGSDQKVLSFNEDLDAVVFIQRKSPAYVMNPAPTTTGAISGGIVAMVTPNWGSSWDSTLVWNNSTYWARYPQGGIYNPMGNTSLSGAYAVASGPVTSANQGWEGNFFASKQLNTMDNVASSTPGAQRFISSAGTTNADSVKKIDFANKDLAITDDGHVRILGSIVNDINSATNNTQYGFRGARIVKGTFSSGIFLWTSDSISLVNTPTDYFPNDLAYNVVDGAVNMAWSENGQTGYLWFLGIRDSASNVTGSNIGIQPLVWKTTNGGNSWTLFPLMNFNDGLTFKVVLDRLEAVETPSAAGLKIPFFNYAEDMSGVVDKNGDLHMVTSLWATRSAHPDSLGIMWTYTNSVGDGQVYRYKHTPGRENYIYDFVTTQTGGWKVVLVDSLETEFIGSTGLGAAANPYNDSPQQIGARIQASRTPGGEFIIYNWADSKYLFTPNALRWNNRPDLYVRFRNVDSSRVFPDRYDLTGFSTAGDVYTSAYMHHISPKAKVSVTSANNTTVTTLSLPVKVTSSNPLVADAANTHYYASAQMSFTVTTVGIADNGVLGAGISLFPNPAARQATLLVDLQKQATLDVSVLNIVGQEVKRLSVPVAAGETKIDLDLSGLSSGAYLVNVRANGAVATKKLMVE